LSARTALGHTRHLPAPTAEGSHTLVSTHRSLANVGTELSARVLDICLSVHGWFLCRLLQAIGSRGQSKGAIIKYSIQRSNSIKKINLLVGEIDSPVLHFDPSLLVLVVVLNQT
jgi:hypothetical protein